MSKGFKDWKLKIDKLLDIFIVLLSVIIIAFFTFVMIDLVSTTPDEEAKQMIQKTTYEGHEYLIYRHRGICHSPECRCFKKGGKE